MLLARRTKIVATTGPASDSDRQLSELIRAGADCLRFNFSHGTAAEHVVRIRRARAAARRVGRRVAVLVDLCGPKIRTGLAPKEGVRLQRGATVEILPKPVESTPERIGISYAGLAREVRPGQRILLADGRMELIAERVVRGRILARVKTGGTLGAHKGVNLPGAHLSVPAMTAKDRADLAAAAAARPDYVALSFVRSAADLRRCRRAMDALGLADAGLIAKIETPEAVADIDAVMAECQGVMVARGDLGVEMDPVDVPAVQRMLCERAARNDLLCIVATEMFESMIENPRPTRAEVSDVANAVRDGADAVMLSAETSTGKYPFGAVTMMGRVLAATEQSFAASGTLANAAALEGRGGEADVLALAARLVETHLANSVLVAATETGRTALFLSKSRPPAPILGLSPSERALDRMALHWGVLPAKSRRYHRHGDLIVAAERAAVRFAGAKRGSHVVVLSGAPLGVSGHTNTLQLRKVGG